MPSTDLAQSTGIIALAQVFGIGGIFVMLTLVGVFWTLHRHGGSLAIYLQARGAALEDRIAALSKEVQDCHSERIAGRAEWERDRDRLLNAIQEERDEASKSRDLVSAMYERLINPRLNHQPMAGGRRHYDPKD